MRFQRELKAGANISLDEVQNFYFYLIWVSSSQSGQERSVHKTEDNYNTKLVSVAIHLAGRLSCICLHLLKSWWEINEEAGLQLSVAPKRINGFSVNMTVSLDLHRYEDEVSEEKLHDDSSLLSLTTRTWLLLDNFCRVANLVSFLPPFLTWWKIT